MISENQQQNNSGLHPKGRAVLIRMVEIDDLKTTMIQIPDHVRKSSAVMEQRAVVVAVGASAWEDEKEPRAKVGEKVIVTKMAGYVVQGKDGGLYRLVNDRDIFCGVED